MWADESGESSLNIERDNREGLGEKYFTYQTLIYSVQRKRVVKCMETYKIYSVTGTKYKETI